MKISYSKDTFKNRSFKKSLGEAIYGIATVIMREKHMRFHLFIGIIVIIFGFIANISIIEWFMLLTAINMVITTEMINTAIEINVDLVTKQKKMRAKLAKDIAAGAVLLSSIFAIVIGVLVFYNEVIKLIGDGLGLLSGI